MVSVVARRALRTDEAEAHVAPHRLARALGAIAPAAAARALQPYALPRRDLHADDLARHRRRLPARFGLPVEAVERPLRTAGDTERRVAATLAEQRHLRDARRQRLDLIDCADAAA